MWKYSKDYSGAGLLIGGAVGLIICILCAGFDILEVGMFCLGPCMFIGVAIGMCFKKKGNGGGDEDR